VTLVGWAFVLNPNLAAIMRMARGNGRQRPDPQHGLDGVLD